MNSFNKACSLKVNLGKSVILELGSSRNLDEEFGTCTVKKIKFLGVMIDKKGVDYELNKSKISEKVKNKCDLVSKFNLSSFGY